MQPAYCVDVYISTACVPAPDRRVGRLLMSSGRT